MSKWEDLPENEKNKVHDFYQKTINNLVDEIDKLREDVKELKKKSSRDEFNRNVYDQRKQYLNELAT